MRLKVFSDPAYISPVRPMSCAMMAPFFGDREAAFWSTDTAVLDTYIANSAQYFDFVQNLADADFAVLPSTWHRYLSSGTEQIAYDFAQKVADAGKPLIVFHERDYDFKFPFPNAILFSPALEHAPTARQFGLPAWIPDHMGAAAPLRHKQDRPVVGFCGWIPAPTLSSRVRRVARMTVPGLSRKRMRGVSAPLQPNFRYKFLRFRSIARLRDHPEVTDNFILRDKFFAGANIKQTEQQQMQSRAAALQEYLDNLRNSDYSLCVRGIGNYSLRFYETLAAGRVPLFLDTHCALPYSFAIDWRDELVWVDPSDHAHVGQKLVTFHAAETAESFQARQQRMRALWVDWVSPDGFFRNFHRHFDHGVLRLA